MNTETFLIGLACFAGSYILGRIHEMKRQFKEDMKRLNEPVPPEPPPAPRILIAPRHIHGRN